MKLRKVNNSKYFVTKENFNSDYIVNLIEDAIKNQKNNRKELKNTSIKFIDDVIDSICYR